MTAFAGAHVMRNAVITIDDVVYGNQVTKARLVPDTPIQTLRTLVPDGVVQDVDSTIWTLELSGVQAYGTGSLGAALNAASGTQIEVIVQPKAGTAQDVATCTIIAMPVEFGGEQGNFRTFDATFPIVGAPVFSQSAGG
jgi:hypothetical protein